MSCHEYHHCAVIAIQKPYLDPASRANKASCDVTTEAESTETAETGEDFCTLSRYYSSSSAVVAVIKISYYIAIICQGT